MSVKEVIVIVGEVIRAQNVFAASRTNKRVIVLVLQESMMACVMELGLSVEPHIFIPVSPLDFPLSKSYRFELHTPGKNGVPFL